ncbi:MAG: SIMPL domain-containing protein, partial [Alphaproteobacteria bacterium]|nr:SIMPL domain-containing protein [Alphaproteobacteria bacterium]
MENKVVAAALIAVGLTAGGFFPGYYYYKTHADARSVLVKGLAEQNVKADLAIWNLKIVVSGNDLQETQQKIAAQAKQVTAFLTKRGFTEPEITVGALETNDLMANPYRDNTAASTSKDTIWFGSIDGLDTWNGAKSGDTVYLWDVSSIDNVRMAVSDGQEVLSIVGDSSVAALTITDAKNAA